MQHLVWWVASSWRAVVEAFYLNLSWSGWKDVALWENYKKKGGTVTSDYRTDSNIAKIDIQVKQNPRVQFDPHVRSARVIIRCEEAGGSVGSQSVVSTPVLRNNILRRGDVDPHPVYLTNGKIRLYFRTLMNSLDPAKRGIGYCDSDDGLKFDSLQSHLLIPDTALPRLMKLDPAIIKFPNGAVACYIGAAPGPGIPSQESPKLIVAWQRTATKVGKAGSVPSAFQFFQNYPNPFNPTTTIRFEVGGWGFVSMKVFDVLGREVATLMSQPLDSGPHSVVFDGSPYPSGVYFYRLQVKNSPLQRPMVLLK